MLYNIYAKEKNTKYRKKQGELRGIKGKCKELFVLVALTVPMKHTGTGTIEQTETLVEHAMYLTLTQAAKETGKSKGTISRYLKNGKMSYIEKTEKNYKLDPSEVFRVFPKETSGTGTIEQTETLVERDRNIESNIEKRFLLEKIAMLESSLEKSEEREKDLSAKLDKAQSTIEKQTYLISDMREKTIEKSTESQKGFFGMFSRAGG